MFIMINLEICIALNIGISKEYHMDMEEHMEHDNRE